LHKIILKSYDKIDLFIAPSKFLIAKFKEWGMDTAKFHQLYNFVDLEQLTPATQIGEGLIYFGRLSEEKGLLVLLKAMKELPDIKLKIVGQGPQLAILKEFIKDNQLANVELTGYKTGQELYDLVRASRLVVLPSTCYENNPLALLEAFALAKPVIGSNLGGMAELITEAKTGFLFAAGNDEELASKIKDNYNNTQLLGQIGVNGRLFVEQNCSKKAYYQKLLELYQKALK